MPTKSNNTGGRGGKRQGAGRKKTAVREKYENGNPGGRKLEVLNIPDMQGEDMPEPHEFLSARQHDGSTLSAADIYRETWEWLDGLGVAKAVSPYRKEENPKIAVEVLLGHGMCHIIAETSVHIPKGEVTEIVRRIARNVKISI